MGSTHPVRLWNNEAIGVNEVTVAVPCDGYRSKTVYFLTDTNGNITIDVDPDGEGMWIRLNQDVGIGVRAVTNPYMYRTEHDFIYLRVQFSAAATVTCWVVRGAER